MGQSSWSAAAMKAAYGIRRKIKRTPFIQELMQGTLRYHAFRYYLEQDEIYLDGFRRAIGVVAGRIPDESDREFFRYLEQGAIDSERSLHHFYLGENPDMDAVTQSEVCRRYCDRLLHYATSSPVHVAMASLLPCFLVYNEVGKYMVSHSNHQSNKYIEWINTYSGEQCTVDADRYQALCDRMASSVSGWQRWRMTRAFICAARMDLKFWEDAYAHGESHHTHGEGHSHAEKH